MMPKALRTAIAAWVLPAGASLIAYTGFFTNYTTDVFSPAGIAAQYGRSVFRYRVLGPWLVTEVADRLRSLAVEWPAPRAFTVLDPSGEAATYWAYILVHTFFTCLGCAALLSALRRGRAKDPELTVVGVGLLMALAAFVVTPYDGLFFCFQMAALGVTLWVPPMAALAPLALVTFFAAITRETALFIPVFYAAVYHRRLLAGDRDTRVTLAVSSVVAVGAYAALRVLLGWSGGSSVYYAWQWAFNFKWQSLVGTITLLGALALLLDRGPNRAARLAFAAMAVPYIVFAHVFAEPWEWRLWVPVAVPLLALRAMDDEAGEWR